MEKTTLPVLSKKDVPQQQWKLKSNEFLYLLDLEPEYFLLNLKDLLSWKCILTPATGLPPVKEHFAKLEIDLEIVTAKAAICPEKFSAFFAKTGLGKWVN